MWFPIAVGIAIAGGVIVYIVSIIIHDYIHQRKEQ